MLCQSSDDSRDQLKFDHISAKTDVAVVLLLLTLSVEKLEMSVGMCVLSRGNLLLTELFFTSRFLSNRLKESEPCCACACVCVRMRVCLTEEQIQAENERQLNLVPLFAFWLELRNFPAVLLSRP